MHSSSPASPPDFLVLHPRNELGLLLGQWTRPVTPPELQLGYDLLLRAAAAAHLHYWLLDVRGRGPANEDDTHWVLTDFLPRAAAQLRERLYLAFVVPAGQLSAQEQETGSPMVMDEQAHVRLFAAEEPARQWLAGRRRHHSA